MMGGWRDAGVGGGTEGVEEGERVEVGETKGEREAEEWEVEDKRSGEG
jgi:hypothetical protein